MKKKFKAKAGIPVTTIPVADLRKIEIILCNANKVLKRIHEFAKKELATANESLPPKQRKQLSFKKCCIKYFAGNVAVTLTTAEQHALAEMKRIQSDLVCSHVGSTKRIAKSFAGSFGYSGCEWDRVEDLQEEALVGLVYATYTYNDPKVKFSTYAWHVMQNHMRDYLTKHRNGMSPRREEDNQVLSRIWDYVCTQTDRVTFDEACRVLEIEPEIAQNALRASKRCDSFAGSMEMESGKEFTLEPIVYDTAVIDPDLQKAVDTADLRDVERFAFNESILKVNGWITKVANSFVDPKTGKNYTHAAITNTVLPGATRKIRKRYDEILSRHRKVA